MEKLYSKSRKIISILAVVISFFVMINEDISVKIVAMVFIFSVALAASYITTPISKKMLKMGDAIRNKYLRVLLYMAILPLTLLIAYIFYVLILAGYYRYGNSISMAAITVFLYVATTIVVIVPYVQTLIVLMLRRLK